MNARVLLVAILMAAMITSGCSNGQDTQGSSVEEAPAKAAKSSVSFDASNYAVLVSDPDAHKGAPVEIVGRVFGEVEKDGSGTYFQMFASPKNSEWNTIVMYSGDAAIASDDFVRVIGECDGAFKGENAFGAEVTAVKVVAKSVEKVDATAAGAPPTKTVKVGTSADQHGLVVTIDKVEFTSDDTRVYVTVKNGTKDKASFYSFNAKAVQGSTQSDAESFTDYPEVQSELLPGISSSGVIAFGPLEESQPVKFYFEGQSDNWDLDFKPYQFTIEP